ncbi:MAG TPA: hypothetical protein VH373_20795 [Jatrophihabitantaceae bacterium]|jgi:hypothetical protein
MNARRRQQLRVAVCLGLPALALALCTVLGLGGTAAAQAAGGHHGHHGHAAMAPAPHRPLPAIMRMQDPIGFDLVAAEHTIQTSHAADPASSPATPARVSIEHSSAHSRGPPAGEPV